ncbi:hypothetical protein [Bacillus smithii]|uniref:hypothetical protein n=1 Tax=Bacillus smithii TaxID=1479 RepID=UPI003D21A1C7
MYTEGTPEEITNKNEYEFLINTVHSYVETVKGVVFLGKGVKNKSFIKMGNILIIFALFSATKNLSEMQ